MRAWMIIVFVLLALWLVLIGPPVSWWPYLDRVWVSVGPLGLWILAVFTYPGRWVLSLIWPGFFRLTMREVVVGASWTSLAVAAFAWGFTYTFSFIFWDTLLSRLWKFIGRWNPFDTRAYWGRPYFLKMVTGISDWWERETKFGQHATGGFAGLLGVLAYEFQHGDIFLGRPKLIIGGMLRPIGIPTEKHMVTLSQTGAGKSTAALIPNLCLHEGSIPRASLLPSRHGVVGMAAAVCGAWVMMFSCLIRFISWKDLRRRPTTCSMRWKGSRSTTRTVP
jgi:hypothetical protein